MYYTPYAHFIAQYFTGKVQKLPIDAGLSCPVRDGKLSRGGCAFCNAQSFVPPSCARAEDIVSQLQAAKTFFARKIRQTTSQVTFLAYFQSGTNTYASVQHMQPLIEAALTVEGVRGVVLATRPDCLSDEWVNYLQTLSQQCFVMVELGVESIDNEVLANVGRCHDVATSERAIARLHGVNIPVCVHVILGLPHERTDYIPRLAQWLNAQSVEVVKLHQLQIVRGSRMAADYQQNPAAYNLFSLDAYVKTVVEFLQHLSPNVAVERFVSQSPYAQLIAPRWGVKNDEVLLRIQAELKKKNHGF